MMVTQSKGDGFALYGGVKLPNIDSVWTEELKQTHPWAFVTPFGKSAGVPGIWRVDFYSAEVVKNGEELDITTNGRYSAFMTATPTKELYDAAESEGVTIEELIDAAFGLSFTGWSKGTFGTLEGETGPGGFVSIPDGVTWSSKDILNTDGSTYLAASDPIPLDGMEVIEWDGDTTGLEKAGMLYKVSDLITASDGYAVAAWSDIKETHRLAYNDIFGFYSAPADVPFYVGLASGNASIADGTWFYADPEENGRTSLFAYTVSDTPEHPDGSLVHSITVESGDSVRLTTAGKYCDRDIVVTASGSSSYVIGAPVPFTLSADSWNGTRYELYAYLYAPGEYGVQIGLPSSGGAANAQRVVKAALTIHSVYTYTGSDTTQPYCRLYIVAVDTPTEDIDIVLFGLTPVADTVVA